MPKNAGMADSDAIFGFFRFWGIGDAYYVNRKPCEGGDRLIEIPSATLWIVNAHP